MVLSIRFVSTTLPSTFSVPVPPLPTPEKLLKAKVATPRPSYLKSNSMVCGPGGSASAACQETHSRLSRFQQNFGLPLSR